MTVHVRLHHGASFALLAAKGLCTTPKLLALHWPIRMLSFPFFLCLKLLKRGTECIRGFCLLLTNGCLHTVVFQRLASHPSRRKREELFMKLRLTQFAQFFIIWSLVAFQGTELSHSICNDTYNNQGPYYMLDCYTDEDCYNFSAGWACQEEDCENCLHEATGQSQYCVPEYDCGSTVACSQITCT